MGTSLFDAPVFGPVNSRRLGVSLGINLLPKDGKVCSFNCIYCECGLNEERHSVEKKLPSRALVKEKLEERLSMMRDNGDQLNVITFAGNGEPTLHPDFKSIVEDVIVLRNNYFPEVKISVLSNAAHLKKNGVFEALKMLDNNIQKLDSAVESTFRCINEPNIKVSVDEIVHNLSQFGKGVIIQTLFCKGQYKGIFFDNTKEEELQALIEAYKLIQPDDIMIYSLSRDTPINSVYKVEKEELEVIATRLRKIGFKVEVA